MSQLYYPYVDVCCICGVKLGTPCEKFTHAYFDNYMLANDWKDKMSRDIESGNPRIDISADDMEYGASHVYLLQYTTDTGNFATQCLSFQRGPARDAGINGITHELLLHVLIDRLESFQAGPYACAENAEALGALKHALNYLNKRTAEREKRGVEGTNEL